MNVIIDPRIQHLFTEAKSSVDAQVVVSPATTDIDGNPLSGGSGGARSSTADIVFDGTDISKDISPYLLSLSYTDNEEDQTDDLQISLQDRDELWLKSWLNDAVNAALKPILDSASAETKKDGVVAVATVNAKSGLILRAGQSKQTKRLTAAPFGTAVDVTNNTGKWWAVNYGGQSGYMWSGYLTVVNGAGGADSGSASASGSGGDASTAAASVKRGFPIRATIHSNPGNKILECGEFELDSVDCSGPPSVINIKATSLPFSCPIRQTKKSKAWEAYELARIGEEIAANAGMSYNFMSDYNPVLNREEQTEESDIEFLSRLTHNAGLSLKCSNNSIVVFDQITYEKMPSVMTITKNDGTYLKYKLTTGQAGTKYTSARVSYTTPEGQVIEGIAKTEELEAKEAKDAASAKEQAQTDAQRLEIHQRVESIGEAKELAEKLLRMHNKFSRTASFTFHGDPKLVAGSTIDLKGFGPWSGKYIISQAKHSIGSSGYTTQISLRNVLEAY